MNATLLAAQVSHVVISKFVTGVTGMQATKAKAKLGAARACGCDKRANKYKKLIYGGTRRYRQCLPRSPIGRS
eukprot:6176849-Pleurochrysis_carterae.AAC.1